MTSTQPPGAAGEAPAVTAALERLAAALDPAEYATTLTTRPGHRTCLSVTSRHAQIGDDI